MANTYLQRTPTARTNDKKYTISIWFKKSALASAGYLAINYENSDNRGYIVLDANDKINTYDKQGGYDRMNMTSNFVLRDCNSWYHYVQAVDTTLSSNRVKTYLNGVDVTSDWTVSTAIQQNDTLGFQSGTTSNGYIIGAQQSPNTFFNGLMTHVHWIDGTQYAASTFGETDTTTGIWKPKTAPSVTYGNNGFFLKFENSGSMGTDSSGNSNNFSIGGGTLTQTLDTPSNVFATMNAATLPAAQVNINKGNLSKTNTPTSNAWRSFYGTIGASSGKYYWELKIDNIESSDPNNFRFGVIDAGQMTDGADNNSFHNQSRGYAYSAQNGNKGNNGSFTSYGSSFTTGDVISCAVDLDNHKIYWAKNGTWQNSGDPTSGSTGTGSAFDLATGYTYLPVIAQYYGNEQFSLNFGNGKFATTSVSSAQNPDDGIGIFEYDVPAGYRSWCTKSLNAEEYS